MKKSAFNNHTKFLWTQRSILNKVEQRGHHLYPTFDYPEYAGLYGKFNASPEACDAMQELWPDFLNQKFKTLSQFRKTYQDNLIGVGEKIK